MARLHAIDAVSAAGDPALGVGTQHRRGSLALALQEAFTAAVRLRANREVGADADSFRRHIKQLLASADQEARRLGYPSDTVRLAVYAYISFLDESILNSAHPMFAQWSGKPLQEEIFGHATAGEIFFDNLDGLLRQQDSEDLADLLEIYQLCLLLGFEGRYSVTDKGALHRFISLTSEKILRIRRAHAALSPSWALPSSESLPAKTDEWLRPLLYAVAITAGIAFLMFLIYTIILGSGVSALRDIATDLLGR